MKWLDWIFKGKRRPEPVRGEGIALIREYASAEDDQRSIMVPLHPETKAIIVTFRPDGGGGQP